MKNYILAWPLVFVALLMAACGGGKPKIEADKLNELPNVNTGLVGFPIKTFNFEDDAEQFSLFWQTAGYTIINQQTLRVSYARDTAVVYLWIVDTAGNNSLLLIQNVREDYTYHATVYEAVPLPKDVKEGEVMSFGDIAAEAFENVNLKDIKTQNIFAIATKKDETTYTAQKLWIADVKEMKIKEMVF